MKSRRSDNQIVSVKSTNPEGSEDAGRGFADFYHYLLTCSWPVLMLQITALFFLVNALFAIAYFVTGGIANARRDSFADVFFFQYRDNDNDRLRAIDTGNACCAHPDEFRGVDWTNWGRASCRNSVC
jgi:hypothetical protein